MSYLFAFSYCSWGSQGKNTEVVCHSLLWWSTFCQYIEAEVQSSVFASLMPSNLFEGFPDSSVGKESACSAGDPVQSLGQGDPLERETVTYSSIRGQRRQVGCSPWGHKELGMTEQLTELGMTEQYEKGK